MKKEDKEKMNNVLKEMLKMDELSDKIYSKIYDLINDDEEEEVVATTPKDDVEYEFLDTGSNWCNADYMEFESITEIYDGVLNEESYTSELKLFIGVDVDGTNYLLRQKVEEEDDEDICEEDDDEDELNIDFVSEFDIFYEFSDHYSHDNKGLFTLCNKHGIPLIEVDSNSDELIRSINSNHPVAFLSSYNLPDGYEFAVRETDSVITIRIKKKE